MTEQELDLFEIAAGLPAELGTGAAEVVGAEVLDTDLARCMLNDVPHGPVAQALADLAALADLPQQLPVLDPGCRLPGVDGMLSPRAGRRRYGCARPCRGGRRSPSGSRVTGSHATSSEASSLSPERAADQQTQDDVITLAFEGLAIGHGEQFPGLLLGEPVAEPRPALAHVRDIGEPGGLLGIERPGVPGLGDQAAHGREPDVDRRGGETLHRAAPFVQDCPAQGAASREGEELAEEVPVSGLGRRGSYRIDHHLPELALGGGEGVGLRWRNQKRHSQAIPRWRTKPCPLPIPTTATSVTGRSVRPAAPQPHSA